MLFYICEDVCDYLESCNEKERIQSVAKLDILLANRQYGRIAVAAKMSTLERLLDSNFFSIAGRNTLRCLLESFQSELLYVKHTKYYIRINGFGDTHTEVKDETSIINAPIKSIDTEMLGKPVLLVENDIDAEVYKLITLFYLDYILKRKGATFDFETLGGGGASTGKVYHRLLSEGCKTVLCIVDSDKMHSDGKIGSTAKAAKATSNKYRGYPFTKLHILYCKEAENLFPPDMLKVFYCEEINKMSFISYMERCPDEVRFFLDYKKGILMKPILKKFNRSVEESVRHLSEFYKLEYAHIELDKCSKKEKCDCLSCTSRLIDGLGENVLNKFIAKYPELRDGFLNLGDNYSKAWACLGEQIFSWAITAPPIGN